MRERLVAVRRFDRPTLVSFIGVGMAWLLLLWPPWGSDGTEQIVALVVGVAYVVGGSLWMASNALRLPDTAWEQVVIPGVLWLAAIVFWFGAWLSLGITAQNDPGTAYLVNGVSIPEDITLGLFTGTASFLLWLLPSLGIRGTWRYIARKGPSAHDLNGVG